jgi:hypothetical protein
MTGTAFVFPLTFGIYCDLHPIQAIKEIDIEGVTVRFYPPYRDKSDHYLVETHSIDKKKVPFRQLQKLQFKPIHLLPAAIAIPHFADDNKEPAGVTMFAPETISSGEVRPRLNQLPKDCFRLDVIGLNEDDAEKVATRWFEHFMDLLRWRSRQWWIRRSNLGISRPRMFSFAIKANGDIVPTNTQYSGVTTVRTLIGSERRVVSTIWTQAIEDMRNGNEPPFHEVLLLDAHYFHALGDLRQAVLLSDLACENLKEIIFKRLWCRQNPGKLYDEERRNKLLRNWDLPRHIDLKFKDHFRLSYKDLFPDHWQHINNLWTTRNNVAHGGPNQFGDPPIEVTPEICREFLRSAEHCVGWLNGL